MKDLPTGNHLLEKLASEDRHVVLTQSTPVEFLQGHVFHEPGDAMDQVHFVEAGIISAVAVLQDGRTVETAMIGREGMTGALATTAPHHAYTRFVAQIDGRARRIDAARLRSLAADRPGVRAVIGAYMARLQGELEQSVACNALHRAEQRFAKWLLACHDRIEGDVIHLTQEYLASMLGSQRTTVNEAAQALQRAGAVAYSRGRMRVRDRSALERAACECYRPAGARIAPPA